jgi:hypothetical protein
VGGFHDLRLPHYNEAVPEVLIILDPFFTKTDREAVLRVAPVTQSISNRVFLAAVSDAVLANLRSMAGIARVVTGSEPTQSLPTLDDAESLFVQAWLSKYGQVKQRRGEGLDWDTPPMLPPDPPPDSKR